MEIIRNAVMSVNDFISKLQTRTSFSTDKDSDNNRITLSFFTPFTWGDGSEKITSLSLDYDANTENIKAITIIGSNLVQIVGYTYMNECYLWFTIKDMTRFNFDHIDDTPGVLILNVQ